MPHRISRIRFGSVLPAKKARIILCKNGPGSDLDGLVRFWPNASGPEGNRCASIIESGSTEQNAAGPLPVSRFQTRLGSSTDVYNSSTLLQGDPNISNNVNSLIFKDVLDFIAQSSRFAME